MLESTVEKHLVKGIEALGGKAYKIISPGNNGIPDRLVCLPTGEMFFVETKAPGEKARALQARQHHILKAMGCVVFTNAEADTIEAVDRMLIFLRSVIEIRIRDGWHTPELDRIRETGFPGERCAK